MSGQVGLAFTYDARYKSVMRLSIFWRLTFGSLIIILMLAGVGVYALVELRHLTASSETLVTSDYPAIETGKRLLAGVYSQLRNEKKYLALTDVRYVLEFERDAEEFRRALAALTASETLPEARALLERVEESHDAYQEAVHGAITGKGEPSRRAVTDHETRRERVLGDLTGALQAYIALHEARVPALAEDSRARSRKAEQVMQQLLGIAVLLGVGLAALATYSILHPLRRLQQHMQTIGQGRFGTRLDLVVPSDLQQLVDTVNAVNIELHELDTMKAEFVQHLTHDLRTPLTSIRMGSQLLLEDSASLTAGQRETLEIIQDSTQRLIQSISNLLDLSKAEAGLLRYHIAPTDLCELAHVSHNKVRFLAQAKDISVQVETPHGAVTAPVDAERMEQVFDNLLSNALKFTPPHGSVRIRIALDSRGGGARITVSDTGCGIPADDVPHIFDRFYQGRRRIGASSGLGLALVKQVIDAHGGEMTVRSEPDHGTTFEIFLPVRLRALEAAS